MYYDDERCDYILESNDVKSLKRIMEEGEFDTLDDALSYALDKGLEAY